MPAMQARNKVLGTVLEGMPLEGTNHRIEGKATVSNLHNQQQPKIPTRFLQA